MKFKLSKGFTGNILLQEAGLLSAVNELNYEELRLYLHLCVLCSNKLDKEIPDICKLAKIETEKLYNVLSVLEKKRLIKISSSGVTLLSSAQDDIPVKRFKSNLDNGFEMMNQNDVTSIIRTAEKAFGKMLSVAEINSLTSLNTWYGLSNDVILILIEYVASSGKRSISLIEKTALEWSELEIDTPAKAHEFVRKSEEKRSVYSKIKALLKIYNRDLTKKEKEFVDKWTDKFTDSEISDAYEKTIDSTGKVSFAYMDKILNSDGLPIKKSTTVKRKANKFSNFEQRNDNYKSIEQKMFEKMINEAEKKG